MRILITGAAGTIGQVLMKCLSQRYEVIGVDKKLAEHVIKLDILQEIDKLKELLQNIDVVIHLAWNVKEAGTSLEPILEENKRMGEIMFRVAFERRVKCFILASSVHVSLGHLRYKYPSIVENHADLHREKKITIIDGFYPLGVYGASKVYLEALGRAYATRELQVIAVRFGNVTPDNNYGEYPFWLSHRDCCQFIEKCCTAKNLSPFSTFFAISNNACNPFDISNAQTYLGYEPEDDSMCPVVNKTSKF